MGFATGKLERIIQGRKGTFNGYSIVGDWLVDVNGKRGWLIQIVNGLERGTFSVVDMEIHRSGIHTPGSVEDSTDIVTDQKEASISKSTAQAISDAIAQWEKDESKKVEGASCDGEARCDKLGRKD